jgi:hypothetical protein
MAEGRVRPGTKLTKVGVDQHILGHVNRRGPIEDKFFNARCRLYSSPAPLPPKLSPAPLPPKLEGRNLKHAREVSDSDS